MDINKLFLKFIERQKTQNSQHKVEEEQSRKIDTVWLQNLLESYWNQDNVVLAKEYTNRSVEQNKDPRERFIQI